MKDDDKKNYYELLRVERTASVEEIKQAYKDIVVVYHPDSNFFSEIVPDASSTPEEIELFKNITNAYQTLINKEKRAAYDKKLNQEGLQRGEQQTGEWIRPDGSFAKDSNSRRKKQPTITNLQKLQKDYQERLAKQQNEHEESVSVADMLQENNSKKNIGFLILLWFIGLFLVVGFFLFVLFL